MEECDAILMSIRRITRAIDLHSKQLVKTSGLSVPQLLVMQAVRRHGDVAIGVIANDVCLSQATVTTIIDRLESQGYVRRERSQDDRRVVHVALTTTGEYKLDETPELIQGDFVREFCRLDCWEQQMLSSTLDRVARMLSAEDSAAAGPVSDIDRSHGMSPQAET
jgi:DNA-binding MarR family transcriptional regulator